MPRRVGNVIAAEAEGHREPQVGTFHEFRERFEADPSRQRQLIPQVGTPEHADYAAELFLRWAVEAPEGAVSEHTHYHDLIAVAKNELSYDAQLALVKRFEEDVREVMAKDLLPPHGLPVSAIPDSEGNTPDEDADTWRVTRTREHEEITTVEAALDHYEIHLRLFFHALDDGDRELWGRALKSNHGHISRLLDESDIGFHHRPEFHVLFNLFLLVRLAEAMADLPETREKVRSALEELVENASSRVPAVLTDLQRLLSARGVGTWLVPLTMDVARAVSFDRRPWMMSFVRSCLEKDAAGDAEEEDRMGPPSVPSWHPPPQWITFKKPSAATSQKPQQPPPQVASTNTTAVSATSKEVTVIASSDDDLADDDQSTLEDLMQHHGERTSSQVDVVAAVGSKRPRGAVDIVAPTRGAIPAERTILTTRAIQPVAVSSVALVASNMATSSSAAAPTTTTRNSVATPNIGGRFECRSQYHPRYASATLHASAACSFCTCCHTMEFLFNGCKADCCWKHRPTERKLTTHLRAFPDILAAARARLDELQAKGWIAPLVIPV